ncbi:hypothetical protein CPB83DRAFT_861889 [Crepidotus variabilis]|uniref:Uncharacterized protein n=1 Tax=Crepidotus variabilis TaxID=179855 RepID=A0A9P6JKC9_9AGAR|nr:hypothetical protein CPB83DRAFT_861889 [Crepidotus variabilis]
MPLSKTIILSLAHPPKISELEIVPDPWVSSSNKILKIDLSLNEHGPRYEPEGEQLEDFESQAFHDELGNLIEEQKSCPTLVLRTTSREDLVMRNEMLARRLRKIVAQDCALPKTERIDAVEIGPDPESYAYSALDGISPKHIKLSSGFAEEIHAEEIENLFYPWEEIESAEIVSECMGWHWNSFLSPKGSITHASAIAFPEFISRVKSLQLTYCHQFRFRAKHLPMEMVNFKIIGNDAMSAFCNAFDNIPGFNDRLQRLHLASNDSQCESGDAFDFKERLQECTAIRDLFLALGDQPRPIAEDSLGEQSPGSTSLTGTVYDMPLDDYHDGEDEDIEGFDENMANVSEDETFNAEKERRQHLPGRPTGRYWNYFYEVNQSERDNDTRLSLFIPSSIEFLSFHCSSSDAMFKDLDYWIDAAKNDTWLPNLKQITIRPDGPLIDRLMEKKVEGNEKQLKDMEAKIEQIYASLKKRKSRVVVVP